jgi:hypothetical protein
MDEVSKPINSVVKQAMKRYGEVEIQLHNYLPRSLDGGEWSASRPRRFNPRERDLQYPLDRSLSWPQNSSGRCGEENKLAPTRNRTAAVQITTSSYTDRATPVPRGAHEVVCLRTRKPQERKLQRAYSVAKIFHRHFLRHKAHVILLGHIIKAAL